MDNAAFAAMAEAHRKNRKVSAGRWFSSLLHFFSLKTVRDCMAPEIKECMEEARVTPRPFYQDHKYFLPALIFILFMTGLLATFGIPLLLPVGAPLLHQLGITAASLAISCIVIAAYALVYNLVTAIIGYCRHVPAPFEEPKTNPMEGLFNNDKAPEPENKEPEPEKDLQPPEHHPSPLSPKDERKPGPCEKNEAPDIFNEPPAVFGNSSPK